MNIKKYFYIANKNTVLFNFNFINKLLYLESLDLNRNLKFLFNYFHYKGYLGKKNNLLIFRNQKSIEKFVRKITNLIKGFLRGFCLILEIIGLGFSVTNNNNNYLRFNIGYNHSIFYYFTKNVKICSKRKLLFIFSYSYFILKNVVTDIKNFRKLNVYKLKGIKEKNKLYVKKN